MSTVSDENGNLFFPGILVYKKQFPKRNEMFKYLYINQLKVVNTCMLWRKDIHCNNSLTFRNTYGNFNVDWDFILRFSLVKNIYGINKVLVKMNRKKTNYSVTSNRWQQYLASRTLLKDFKEEFPYLVSDSTYTKALKTHCKIELGYYKKPELFVRSLYYALFFKDLYFLRYLRFSIKKALAKALNF